MPFIPKWQAVGEACCEFDATTAPVCPRLTVPSCTCIRSITVDSASGVLCASSAFKKTNGQKKQKTPKLGAGQPLKVPAGQSWFFSSACQRKRCYCLCEYCSSKFLQTEFPLCSKTRDAINMATNAKNITSVFCVTFRWRHSVRSITS